MHDELTVKSFLGVFSIRFSTPHKVSKSNNPNVLRSTSQSEMQIATYFRLSGKIVTMPG